MRCNYCNAEVKVGMKFCPKCGKELFPLVTCNHCGVQIKAGLPFCPNCGARQNEQIAKPEPILEVAPDASSLQDEMTEEHVQEKHVQEVNEPDVVTATKPSVSETETTLTYEDNQGSKKWLWIVGGILLLGILSGGVYYLINQKAQNTSIATTSEELNVIETRLHDILSKLVTNDGEHYLPEFFTEGFNTYYKRACENADKRMYERPRIWCQESEFDPSEFKINSVTSADGNIISNVTIKGELFSGTYEVLLKKENGNWLIDSVTQKALEYLNSEDGTMMDEIAAKNNAMEESIIEEKKDFIKDMYKDFFENNNFDTQDLANLKKYLAPNVIKRIYLECPYDGCEGEKRYIVDVFYDSSLSYERPDVTITNRQINNIDYDWFEVVGVDKYTGHKKKVQLEIRMGDNGYQVTDFKSEI